MGRFGRTGAILAVSGALLAVGGAAAVVVPVRAQDPDWLLRTKLLARQAVLDAIRMAVDDDTTHGPLTPLEGPGYVYEDLAHPYLERVRSDPRVSGFYGDGPIGVEKAAAMADFLRARFPRARPQRDPDRDQVLALLDRADAGEAFLCGTAAKMLVQLVQAGGGTGRRVRLGGHVVAEIWDPMLEKWVLIDPDTNVRFEDREGRPLSVLEVHELAVRGDRDAVVAIPGAAPTTYDDDYLNSPQDVDYTEYQLHKYYRGGFAVDYYAKWLTLDRPTWDPRVHPSFTSVVWQEPGAPESVHLQHFGERVDDPALLYAPPPR